MSCFSIDQRTALRKLFSEHAFYTKLYIESYFGDLPDLKSVITRLLKNQEDIGNGMKPIVGDKVGNIVTKLLKEHILAAAGAIDALKNNGDLNEAVKKVFANSKQVAQALNSLHMKNVSYETLLKNFNHHNQYVVDIAKLHKNQEFEKELKLFDKYYTHMLYFSDLLSCGLSTLHKHTPSTMKYAANGSYVRGSYQSCFDNDLLL